MTTEAIGLLINLPLQRVMPARLGETDIAVWRSASGQLSAWHNRCPHRGMRLSHGFVRGESLACSYHGWQYDKSGACNYVPAHPDMAPPANVKTTAYAVAEQAGVLWVSSGPAPEMLDLPADLIPIRSMSFSCSIDNVTNAFLDCSAEIELGKGPTSQFDSKHLVYLHLSSTTIDHNVHVLIQPSETKMQIVHLLGSRDWSSNQLVGLINWSESVRRCAEAFELRGQ
ncbi:MAG: nitrite reductase/ring-hydroxylating ferredoxin subunit [Parasphingorhabdus sp.]|jgi:nitrite reductase/ring-hydroxylating ferredoxin subunit